jgi:Domain of Unknown Function (DUF928)
MYRSIVIPALSLMMLGSGWVGLAGALPNASLFSQATESYDGLMLQGYRATAKRDYHSALLSFRNALRQRAGDRYASRAISNVSRYISDRSEIRNVMVFLPSTGPSGRAHAAVRDANCGGCLIGLLPNLPDAEQANLLSTTADYPTLFFYLKKTSAQVIEFEFTDPAGGKTYNLRPTPPSSSGFLQINLATLKDSQGQTLPPLQVGQTYNWRLTILQNSVDYSNNPSVRSTLTRKALDPLLASTLKQVSPSERVSLYAANDLWYDLVATLYQARQQDPKNAALAGQWTQLLNTINLGQMAQLTAN